MENKIVAGYVCEKDHYARDYPDKAVCSQEDAPMRLAELRRLETPQPSTEVVEAV